MSWHIDDTTLARYVAGGTTAAVAASAEAHLTTCADCRARLTPQLDTGRLDAIWHGVDDRVQLASLPWFERTLGARRRRRGHRPPARRDAVADHVLAGLDRRRGALRGGVAPAAPATSCSST